MYSMRSVGAATTGVALVALLAVLMAATATPAAVAAYEHLEDEETGGGADVMGLDPKLCGGAAQPSTLNQKGVSKIAFGSCNKGHLSQTVWHSIAAQHPDVFVHLGDAVYADRRVMFGVFEPASLRHMQFRFEEALSNHEFARFREHTPVVGVWDDHDFGINNGGSDYEFKHGAQQLFLDFIGEPRSSPRREQQGIYASYMWGPPGRSVRLLLLDSRYHRGARTGHHAQDMLGEEQWKWLEQQLLHEDAATLTLIGSGIQVLLDDRPAGESWSEFPTAYNRLRTLVASAMQRTTVMILSGDVHIAEALWDCLPVAPGDVRHLYEFTSSGLTHSCESTLSKPVCNAVVQLGFPRSQFQFSDRVLNNNFGTLTIDWDASPPAVTVAFHDAADGRVQQQVAVSVNHGLPSPALASCPKHGTFQTSRGRAIVVAFILLLTVFIIIGLAVRTCIRLYHGQSRHNKPE